MAGVFPHGFIGAMSCIEPPCLRTRCVSRKASGHSASESAACIIRSWTKSNETSQLRGSEMTDACLKKMLVGRSVLRENCVQETSTPYNVHWVFGGAVLATSIIQIPGEFFSACHACLMVWIIQLPTGSATQIQYECIPRKEHRRIIYESMILNVVNEVTML